MNINLVCVARNPGAAQQLPQLFEAAVEYGKSIFGDSIDHEFIAENVAMFNADCVRETWGIPTWWQSGDEIVAVSQPAIPVDFVTTSAGYWASVLPIIRQRRFDRLLPGHFGVYWGGAETLVIWADTLGFGRCYYVINDNFIAVSNHIGVLSFFVDGEVEVDAKAVAEFAYSGWFKLDGAPISGIKRLRESEHIEVNPVTGEVRIDTYFDLGELVQNRDARPDFPGVVEELRRVAMNLDEFGSKTPTLYLSGGRDSRMTASLWLGAGSDARVVTIGNLAAEAEIATDLMSAFFPVKRQNQNVKHDVVMRTASEITMPLEERLRRAFLMWDGDAAPANMRRNVQFPGKGGAISIGGVGGEIGHGYYYHGEGQIELASALGNPITFVNNSTSHRISSDYTRSVMEDYADICYQRAVDHRCGDVRSLDYFYLTEKFRRWGNQALGSKSAVMLSSPAFVRANFDMTPQEHVEKYLAVQLVEHALPAWKEFRYYKANPEDSQREMRRKLATFDTDPEFFFDRLSPGARWEPYMRRETLDDYLELVRQGDAGPAHESTLNRAIWIDYLVEHIAALREAVEKARSPRRELINLDSDELHAPAAGPDQTAKDELNNGSPATGKTASEETAHSINSAAMTMDSTPLEQGFFEARPNDEAMARKLATGVHEFGKLQLPIFEANSFDTAELERNQALLMHTLRWADPLRRVGGTVVDAHEAWGKIFNSWCSSQTARDRNSLAWGSLPLEQRATFLALGWESTRNHREQVQDHVEALRALECDITDAERRLKLLRLRTLLMERLEYDPRQICEAGREAVSEVFDEGGFAATASVSSIVSAADQWRTFLVDGLGIAADDPVLHRLNGSEFWPHALAPDGSFVEWGNATAASVPASEHPSMRYVVTHGSEGTPPPR